MALSRKLSKQTDTISVEDLILKGGSSGVDTEEGEESSEDLKRVQLRIPMDKLSQIDQAVGKRPGKLSRHTWIMEAIEEKLARDSSRKDLL